MAAIYPTTQQRTKPSTRRKSTRIKESFGDRVFLTILYIFLTGVLLVVLYPLIYIVSSSLSSPTAVSSGRVWLWPVEFSLRGYEVALSNPQIVSGYSNSLFYALFGTLISVTLTVLLAYPLSRKSFFGRNVIMIFIVFYHAFLRWTHSHLYCCQRVRHA